MVNSLAVNDRTLITLLQMKLLPTNNTCCEPMRVTVHEAGMEAQMHLLLIMT